MAVLASAIIGFSGSIRMARGLRISLVLAALAASPGVALAASAGDATVFGKVAAGGKLYACYTRTYDKAHLASHPKQNTKDMALFVNSIDDESGQYLLTIGVHFRKSSKLFMVSGGCSQSDDGKGTLSCGIECDGGQIDVSVKNETSIHVSIPYGARTWDPESDEEPPANARFGTDDKLFRLDRAGLKDCLGVITDEAIKAEIEAMK
jgi:hypothetical protein